MYCRSPSGHINEYSSIYESNGPGPDGPRSGPGTSNSSNRPFQSSDRSASRGGGESTGRSIGTSASSNSGPCLSYQAEEGRNGTSHRDKLIPPVALAPSYLVQNGSGNGQTSNALGYECKQEHEYEHEHGHEKFSSPLLGYFSLPPQDLEGTASASSRCAGNSSALPSSPFDREYGVGAGAGGEGREERGRGPGRGREGGTATGTGRGKARERSIDSVVSFTSESSYVTVIENSRKPKRPQSVRSDAEASLGLNTYQSHLSLSFGSKIGRLVYDSERKWGSWLGL